MKKQRVGRALLCAALVSAMIPTSAFAATGSATQFADMPNNWSTTALQNAVDNGLITGYDVKGQKLIRPDGTLTRAEMGTIINKAFGAVDKADISKAKDIVSGQWYVEQMQKAVQMGSFATSTELRPNDAITRQEVATVLAKVFKLPEAKATALDSYSDKGSVAAWAKSFVGSMVENGYMTGNNGKLNPTSNITRAEFAAMMNNMVAEYIKEGKEVTSVADKGNVMVSAKDVTLKGASVNGNLVLGDGIGDGNITLDGVKVSGDLVVRGGGVNSIIIKGDSKISNVIVGKVSGNVRVAVEGNASVSAVVVNDGQKNVIVEGAVDKLVIDSATPVVAQKATIKTVAVNAADAALTVDKNSKVETVTVAKAAEKAAVTVAGTVTTIKTEAPNTAVKVESGAKVTTVNTAAGADGTNVNIAKDATVSNLKNDAKITTSGEGKPASTTGSGTVNQKTETTTPGTSGGGGGGGGGSSTPSVSIGNMAFAGQEIKPVGGVYIIPTKAAIAMEDAAVTLKLSNLKTTTTYTAVMSIVANGKTEVAYASASGIETKYLNALSGTEVTLGNFTGMLDRLGENEGWFIDENGDKVTGSAADLGNKITEIFERMGRDDVYTVTISLIPANGGSKGSNSIKISRAFE